MQSSAQLENKPQGYVRDINAAPGSKRVHDIIIKKSENGQPPITKAYSLASDEPTPMPIEHAMKFLVDKSFVVTDEAGNVIEPVTSTEGAAANLVLANNQCIAVLDELTKESLQKRAAILPGSETLRAAASKDELVAFITAHQAETKASGVSRGSEDAIPDMPANELDTLLKG